MAHQNHQVLKPGQNHTLLAQVQAIEKYVIFNLLKII